MSQSYTIYTIKSKDVSEKFKEFIKSGGVQIQTKEEFRKNYIKQDRYRLKTLKPEQLRKEIDGSYEHDVIGHKINNLIFDFAFEKLRYKEKPKYEVNKSLYCDNDICVYSLAGELMMCTQEALQDKLLSKYSTSYCSDFKVLFFKIPRIKKLLFLRIKQVVKKYKNPSMTSKILSTWLAFLDKIITDARNNKDDVILFMWG